MNTKHLRSTKVINSTILESIALWLIILVITTSYGFQYRTLEASVPYYFITASFIFLLFIASLAALILQPKIVITSPKILIKIQLRHLAITLMLANLLMGIYFYSGSAYLPTKSMMILATLVATVLSIAQRYKEALWALAGIGICLFIYLSLNTPLDVEAANMLPIIGAGCDSLLNGENPFLHTYPEIASSPLYYLPLHILPYCPLQSLELDLRWLNVAIFILLIILLIRTFDFINNPEILGLTFFPLLSSPMMLQAGYYGHLWIYWLGLVIMANLLWRGKLWLVAVIVGLLLLTRQTYIFIVGLLGASLISALGWKNCMKYGALSLSIVITGFVSIYLLTHVHPFEFYSAIKSASEVTHKITNNPMDQISLSGLFVFFKMRPILMEMQLLMASVLGVIFILFLKSRPVSIILMLIGIGYVLIISMSVYIHRYFYAPGFILIAYGLALQLKEQRIHSIFDDIVSAQ